MGNRGDIKNLKEERALAILTSGGDAPGMNALLSFLVSLSKHFGFKAYLIEDGYKGLVKGKIKVANQRELREKCYSGGTLIGSARYPKFKQPNVREKAVAKLNKLAINNLIVIGGDGSFAGGLELSRLGVRVVGIPATIDNDINSTEFTIGFDSAVGLIASALRDIRNTADSHQRIFLVEVMGHGCGDLAFYGGIAGGADLIITNEAQLTVKQVVKKIKILLTKKRRSLIIVVSEFIFESLDKLATTIEEMLKKATRKLVLSHLQRGAKPSQTELIRCFEFALKTIELLSRTEGSFLVGYKAGRVQAFPIEAASKPKPNKAKLIKLFNQLSIEGD